MNEDDFDNGAPEEQATLPKATVGKIINDILPSNMQCPKETKDLITECCVEFIHLLSSEANEISEKDSKKTILPDHVFAALKSLGFEEFKGEVDAELQEHAKQMKERGAKSFKLSDLGMTEEEMIASQQELFAAARRKYDANSSLLSPNYQNSETTSIPTAEQLPFSSHNSSMSISNLLNNDTP